MGNLKKREKIVPWLYCLPGIIFMGVFIFIPILLSLVMSFFGILSVGAPWEYVGFQNYAFAFRDNEFLYALLRTLGFGIFGLVTGMGMGILLSLMVANHKWLSFYRYIFYVPSVVSAITMGRLWQLMLTPDPDGVLNQIVAIFGVEEPVNWLGSPDYTWMVVLGIGLIGCGGGMTLILFTTAINNVSKELTEAAELEGANAFQRSVHIVIPLIRPVISSMLILSIIGSFKSFEFIYTLTGGKNNTTTIAILLYNNSLSNPTGYGGSAAMGFILTVIVLLFITLYLFVDRKEKAAS